MAGRIRSDAARQPGAAGANPAVFSAGVGFPYVLRVFAQEIVPRPDSGSAFVCKSHVRLRGLAGARFYYVDHFRKKAACGGSLFFKKNSPR